MAGLVVALMFVGGAEVVGIPLGGYVFSNYITKQKSWLMFTIGAVGTAVLIPVSAVSMLSSVVGIDQLYAQQKPKKNTSDKLMGIQD
jgi:hypothetical protein